MNSCFKREFYFFIRLCYNLDMSLNRKTDKTFIIATAVVLVFAVVLFFMRGNNTFAGNEGEAHGEVKEHFVTIEDGNSSVTVKTTAQTVEELLRRADVVYTESDIINPGLESKIDMDDMVVSIWRARPVVIKDGVREKYLLTTEVDAREIVVKYGEPIYEEDEVALIQGYDFLATGPAFVYNITRNHVEPEPEPEPELDLTSKLGVSPLTARRGVNQYTVNVNGRMVNRKETYYDLPMGGVMSIAARECKVEKFYTVREDGVKVDAEGYVLVAADLNRYPRCTIVETSLGMGRVYDTGSFALSNPEQFDLATDWTNRNGR